METIQLSIIISMASLGFRCITGKGMIFYFMREWLDKKANHKQETLDEIERINKELDAGLSILKEKEIDSLIMAKSMLQDENLNKHDTLLYIMKPFILCSTCMASVHTFIWFPIITGSFNWSIILVMLIVAFLNTLLFSLIEKIQK